MDITVKAIRLQRNILLGIVICMCVTNTILAIKLLRQEIITRNLPHTEQELIIGSNYVNDAALKLRAEQILYLLFSMKRENTGLVQSALLRQVDSLRHQDFKKQISKLAADIKARGYRYCLSDIVGYEFDNFKFSVRVKAYVDTYLADKKIATNYKEYHITFINRAGLLNLGSFEEVKEVKELKEEGLKDEKLEEHSDE